MFRHFRLLFLLLVFWSVTAAAESPLAAEMAAVEKIRGLKFKHTVAVKTIARSEIPERVRAEMRRQMPYPVDDYIAVLRALQLVDGKSSDLTDKLLALYESQVLAYYDPTKHIYFDVRELPDAVKDAVSPELLKKSVAVHELTHALQDQYFSIGTKDDRLRDDWDGQLAYHSVIEGEASLVMIGWHPSLAIYTVLHVLIVLALMGQKMAARYEMQPAWREKYSMDEYGVARLGKAVTRGRGWWPVGSSARYVTSPRLREPSPKPICRNESRTAGTMATNSATWSPPSTACSTGSRTVSRLSADSSTTQATNCALRSQSSADTWTCLIPPTRWMSPRL